jgi:hypothetical protein
VLAEGGVANAESSAQLVEREVLGLFGRRGELHLEVAENLVLQSRLAAGKLLERLGERDLARGLLELLSDNDADRVDGLWRDVFDRSSGTAGRSGDRRRGRSNSDRCGSRCGCLGRSRGGSLLGGILKGVVDLLLVLGGTEDLAAERRGTVLGFVLGLREEDVLGLNPSNRGRESEG